MSGLDLNPATAVAIAEGSEARAYAELFTAAALPGFECHDIGGATALLSLAAPGVFIVNRVLGYGIGRAPDDAWLDALMTPFRERGQGFALELARPDPDGSLQARLKAAGLRRISVSQVLLRDGQPPPPRYESWARGTGLRVEAVDADRAASVAALCVENFAVPPAVGELLAAGTRGPAWRRWLALDGDTPVGASLSFVAEGVCWLGWTSVSPSHRGRWVHAGIVARQLEDAAAAGCGWVSTETARSTKARPDPSHYNQRSFGFQDAYLRPTLAWVPPRATKGA